MKKTILNRALALLLVMSALFALPAFAANSTYTDKDIEISLDNSAPLLDPQFRGALLADDAINGTKNHSFSFSTNRVNGGQVLVTINNTGNTVINISAKVTDRKSGENLTTLTGYAVPGGDPGLLKITDKTGLGAYVDVTVTLSANPGETISSSYTAVQGDGLF